MGFSLQMPPRGKQVIIFGEVLLDCFPDGSSVIGGAPFNVAWNLKGFGRQPAFLSAVGGDAEAKKIREHMNSWGLPSTYVAEKATSCTGRVTIELVDGQPSYNIEAPAAYDSISLPSQLETGPEETILYHGSLALRGEVSKATLHELARLPHVLRFVDLNIRDPWFSLDIASEFLTGAKWVKLNDEEIGRLTNTPTPSSEADVRRAIDLCRQRYGGETYFVTCGAHGAFASEMADGGQVAEMSFCAAPTVPNLCDTVGAGDAFAAAMLHNLLEQRSAQDALSRATNFAAKVCAIRGATTSDATFYTFPA